MGGVAGFGARAGGGGGTCAALGDADGARLPVQFKEHLDVAGVVAVAERQQLDFQGLAGVDLDADLLARFHPVEEGRGGQGADRAVDAVTLGIVGEHLGVHQPAVQVLVVDRAFQRCFQLGAGGGQIDRRHQRAGAGGDRGLALQHLALQRRRPAPGRLAQVAAHHVDHRIGEGDLDRGVLDLRPRQPLRHHHQRHVAHHL